MKKGSRITLTAALLGMLAGGCASAGFDVRPVQHGRVAQDGITIEAQDGSFTLRGGEDFEPPFQVDTYAESGGTWNRGNVSESAEEALDMGARRVRVDVPGLEEPLYGVLLLSMAPEDVSSPAWRSYRIQVPEQYIRAAVGGVSVVYELGRIPTGEEWFSWILWLADTPFQS